MKHEPKPTPMLADASTHDDVRELLTFARASGPSQAGLDRLAQRLSPLVGVAPGDLSTPLSDLGTAPANPAGTGPMLGAAGKAATKLTLSATSKALVAVGVMSVGALWWASSSTPAARTLPSVPKAVIETKSAAPQELPSAPEGLPSVSETSPPRPAPARVVRRARKLAPGPAVEAAEAPTEIELIRRAEALRAQPTQALRSLNDHARLYPEGMLAQEREVLAIEALVASGQRDAAQARADRLASQHPGSAHLRRVRVLLGAGSSE